MSIFVVYILNAKVKYKICVGTPRRAAALAVGARGTPKNAAGARASPMSARRTPGSTSKVKPVTKYKDTGCQTSPGFVRRAKHCNGDVNGVVNGDNNENEPAKANGVKVRAKDNMEIYQIIFSNNFKNIASLEPPSAALRSRLILVRLCGADYENNGSGTKLRKSNVKDFKLFK